MVEDLNLKTTSNSMEMTSPGRAKIDMSHDDGLLLCLSLLNDFGRLIKGSDEDRKEASLAAYKLFFGIATKCKTEKEAFTYLSLLVPAQPFKMRLRIARAKSELEEMQYKCFCEKTMPVIGYVYMAVCLMYYYNCNQEASDMYYTIMHPVAPSQEYE